MIVDIHKTNIIYTIVEGPDLHLSGLTYHNTKQRDTEQGEATRLILVCTKPITIVGVMTEPQLTFHPRPSLLPRNTLFQASNTVFSNVI